MAFYLIIPHVKIVSRDWLTKVGHSVMSTDEMSTGKTSTVLTGSTRSHCCFRLYFTKLGFVRYNKTNIPCQCGYPDGIAHLGRMVFSLAPPSGKPSSLWETFHQDTHTGMAYLYNVGGVKMIKRCSGWKMSWRETYACGGYCSIRNIYVFMKEKPWQNPTCNTPSKVAFTQSTLVKENSKMGLNMAGLYIRWILLQVTE